MYADMNDATLWLKTEEELQALWEEKGQLAAQCVGTLYPSILADQRALINFVFTAKKREARATAAWPAFLAAHSVEDFQRWITVWLEKQQIAFLNYPFCAAYFAWGEEVQALAPADLNTVSLQWSLDPNSSFMQLLNMMEGPLACIGVRKAADEFVLLLSQGNTASEAVRVLLLKLTRNCYADTDEQRRARQVLRVLQGFVLRYYLKFLSERALPQWLHEINHAAYFLEVFELYQSEEARNRPAGGA